MSLCPIRNKESGMLRGPKREKRPADLIGAVVMLGRLSVGVETEEVKPPSGRVRGGHAGAKARSASLLPDERSIIARVAARASWVK